MRAALEAALAALAAQGAELVDVTLPHTPYAIDTYYLINTSEVSSNLARFDGVRYGARLPADSLPGLIAGTRNAGFGPEAKRRILLGAFCLSKGYYDAFYLKALKTRTLITRDFHGRVPAGGPAGHPRVRHHRLPPGRQDRRSPGHVPHRHLHGHPLPGRAAGAVLPAGFSEGMPVGLQLIGPSRTDVRLLEVAHAFQQITRHHLQHPPLTQESNHGLRYRHAPDGRVHHRGHHPEVASPGGRDHRQGRNPYEISTDKVDAEIPAPIAGTLLEILVEVNATVPGGHGGGPLGDAGEQPTSKATVQPAGIAAPGRWRRGPGQGGPGRGAAAAPAALDEDSLEGRLRTKSSPLVRRMAEKQGVDLAPCRAPGSWAG